MLHFRWTNESCTLDMLIDKKSEGFKNTEAKLANEVELLLARIQFIAVYQPLITAFADGFTLIK